MAPEIIAFAAFSALFSSDASLSSPDVFFLISRPFDDRGFLPPDMLPSADCLFRHAAEITPFSRLFSFGALISRQSLSRHFFRRRFAASRRSPFFSHAADVRRCRLSRLLPPMPRAE